MRRRGPSGSSGWAPALRRSPALLAAFPQPVRSCPRCSEAPGLPGGKAGGPARSPPGPVPPAGPAPFRSRPRPCPALGPTPRAAFPPPRGPSAFRHGAGRALTSAGAAWAAVNQPDLIQTEPFPVHRALGSGFRPRGRRGGASESGELRRGEACEWKGPKGSAVNCSAVKCCVLTLCLCSRMSPVLEQRRDGMAGDSTNESSIKE